MSTIVCEQVLFSEQPACPFGTTNFATATVRGSAPVSVTFAVKRGKGSWRRLAVDDSPPYRGFLDPVKYRRNERLQVAAAVRTLDGRVAASKVVPFRIRPR